MRTGISSRPTQLGYFCRIGGSVFASLFFGLVLPGSANDSCIEKLTSNVTLLLAPTQTFRATFDTKESRGVKFSPDGKWVATISDDRTSTVRVLDATTGQLLFSPKLGGKPAGTISWSPKGELFVAHNNMLSVFSREVGGQWVQKYSMFPSSHVLIPRGDTTANFSLTSISFNPDGNYFIGSILHYPPMVFRTVDGAWMYTIPSNALLFDADVSPRFTSDGKRIVLIGGKSGLRTLKTFDAKDGKSIESRSVFWSDIDSFDVSPNGRSYSYGISHGLTDSMDVVSRDFGAYFRNWKQKFSLINSNYFTKVKYSPDGKRIFAASYGSTLNVLDTKNGQLLAQVNYKVKYLNFVVSPDSRILAVLTGFNEIEILEGRSGKKLATLPLMTVPFYVDFYSDASGKQMIAVGEYDGSVSVWSF